MFYLIDDSVQYEAMIAGPFETLEELRQDWRYDEDCETKVIVETVAAK